MRLTILLLVSATPQLITAQSPTPAWFDRPMEVVDSIPAPESVAIGPDGSWYVSSFGKFGVKGNGAVYRVNPESLQRNQGNRLPVYRIKG